MIVLEKPIPKKLRVAVFDFDGTLSTLRAGWERVMEPLMLEVLCPNGATEKDVRQVRDYISASTGIQTVLQMKARCEMVRQRGGTPLSPWEYKAEYNRRLMENVALRRAEARESGAERYLMRGAREFLCLLKERGVGLFAASGTDEADVISEAEILGLRDCFDGIAGAKPLSEDCSKEATLRRLIEENGSDGLLVVGDGPVEIRLGRAVSAATLGIVGLENEREGYDPVKVRRLTDAGAHLLVDCFKNAEEILGLIEGEAK